MSTRELVAWFLVAAMAGIVGTLLWTRNAADATGAVQPTGPGALIYTGKVTEMERGEYDPTLPAIEVVNLDNGTRWMIDTIDSSFSKGTVTYGTIPGIGGRKVDLPCVPLEALRSWNAVVGA